MKYFSSILLNLLYQISKYFHFSIYISIEDILNLLAMNKNNEQANVIRDRLCMCLRARLHWHRRLKKEQGKRKRQMLVFNPEEETWHEPYMKELRREFSDVSLLCDSKVELPWKDFALPAAGMRIRQDSTNRISESEGTVINADDEIELKKKESTGKMPLPWNDLVITAIVEPKADAMSCGSSLEIPWNDLAFEKPCIIEAQKEETCGSDDVEIPWDDIMIPENLIIESPKKKKHPSSKRSPLAKIGDRCPKHCECCGKIGTNTKPTMFCI